MRPRHLSTLLPALALAFCIQPTVAKADTLTVTGTGYGLYGVPITADMGAWAVQINVKINNQPYTAFCVDLFTNIGFSSYNTTPSNPDTLLPWGTRLAWIYSTYAPLVASAADPNAAAGALQLALWDVRHDGGDGLDNGIIQLDTSYRTMSPGSAILSAANAIVLASQGKSSHQASILYNFSFDGNHAQALITDGSWPEPTPEPSSMAMMGAGAAAWLGHLWRRRKQVARRESTVGSNPQS